MFRWTGYIKPQKGEGVFIAPSALVTGDVRIGNDSGIFFGSVLRGDINYISIGKRTNIQDLCCLHVADDFPCILGNDVVVGHGAVLHGCFIEDAVLIGIGSIILNGVKIGYGSIIGAGTVVTQGVEISPYSLVLGSPGKVIKRVTEEQVRETVLMAEKYVHVKNRYLNRP